MARKNNYIDQIDQFIGSKIYLLRLSQGLSRDQLSKVIGVTNQQLQKYEKGTNRISIGRLILIARALGKDMSYFYEGLEEKDSQEQIITHHQRIRLDLARNFMRITNRKQQNALNNLVKLLLKEQVV